MTIQQSCPKCYAALSVLPEADPWCGTCEWNLDVFPRLEGVSWFWRAIVRLDQRAGFRAHRRLATADPDERGSRVPYLFLALLSVVIVLADLALAGAGIWVLIHGGSLLPWLFGLLLIGFAVLLRPRLGRVKQLQDESTYVVTAEDVPELHRLVGQVAAETGAPVPDRIHLDFDANASAAVVGLRRTRVLTLGVPLMLALRPQELVALIGHELGHLKYEDGNRALLIQPARTLFGRLSRLVRPKISVIVVLNSGVFGAFYLLLQYVGGLLSLLFATLHTGLAVLAAGDQRQVELRADLMSVRAAGSEAVLSTMDVLAMHEMLVGHISPHVRRGEAGAMWRRLLASVREREAPNRAAYRQLSNRTGASLLSGHPSAGRRYQWLAARPAESARVVVDQAMAARLEREINPYADAMHRQFTDHPSYWD
ncbi:M48 family metallopeptidase [Actinoplanes regularis]|uniref:M48 family metallopeptidase n=1 Tax=Actinoplanes regularis TaxID=52697 RepID=UPI0025523283|nr:M48 family metallopeptidase [Actinoplanes regularis]